MKFLSNFQKLFRNDSLYVYRKIKSIILLSQTDLVLEPLFLNNFGPILCVLPKFSMHNVLLKVMWMWITVQQGRQRTKVADTFIQSKNCALRGGKVQNTAENRCFWPIFLVSHQFSSFERMHTHDLINYEFKYVGRYLTMFEIITKSV